MENRRVNGSRINRWENRTFREFTTPQGPARFIIDVLSRIHHSMTGLKRASLPLASTRLVDNFRFDPRASLLWHRKCTFLYDYPPAILRLVCSRSVRLSAYSTVINIFIVSNTKQCFDITTSNISKSLNTWQHHRQLTTTQFWRFKKIINQRWHRQQYGALHSSEIRLISSIVVTNRPDKDHSSSGNDSGTPTIATT